MRLALLLSAGLLALSGCVSVDRTPASTTTVVAPPPPTTTYVAPATSTTTTTTKEWSN